MGEGKIRVAVGGQGRSGYGIHCKCLRKDTDRFDIVAAADQLPERREDARVDFDAEVYDDWRPMLDAGGFDLFVNALPSPLHVDASIEALNRGFHNGAELLIKPEQSRKQIAVIEECHRQNPLPTRPQSLKPRL